MTTARIGAIMDLSKTKRKGTEMEKQKLHIFKKDVYLLGTDKDGIKYFLEEPSWDCGWYWGFGYIETYENNARPERSRDINSHQHATDFYPDWVLSDKAILNERTFTYDECWTLAQLFNDFYTLKDLAETMRHNGKLGNYTSDNRGFDFRKIISASEDEINRKRIPEVMAKIIAILSPDENETADSLEMKYKDRRNIKSFQKIIG